MAAPFATAAHGWGGGGDPPPHGSPLPPATLRLGQVIELRPEHRAEYVRVHAAGHPGVRDLLAKHNLRNFSIFLQEVHGRLLLFLYCEYAGADYARDMAALAAEPRDAAWHALCDPMQLSLCGGGWQPMEQVFFNA